MEGPEVSSHATIPNSPKHPAILPTVFSGPHSSASEPAANVPPFMTEGQPKAGALIAEAAVPLPAVIDAVVAALRQLEATTAREREELSTCRRNLEEWERRLEERVKSLALLHDYRQMRLDGVETVLKEKELVVEALKDKAQTHLQRAIKMEEDAAKREAAVAGREDALSTRQAQADQAVEAGKVQWEKLRQRDISVQERELAASQRQ